MVALPSATEALRRITSGERYDVIISDIAMPGMSGLELYDAILSVDPAIAATMVFLTGGACSAQAHAFLSRMTNQRIDKPFTPAQLRTFIELRLRS